MLNYEGIRDLYKKADTIKSDYFITAEWNMNKYTDIAKYGVYKGAPRKVSLAYSSTDPRILSGKNYLIYTDETKKQAPDQEFFSQLASVFKPNRPDPGIVLLQKFGNMTFVKNVSNLKASRLNPERPRYYPQSENRPYDYFNSAKILDYDQTDDLDPSDDFAIFQKEKYGISDPRTGNIQNVNPFVVYSKSFPCNKIRIKVQKHLSIPTIFFIDVLIDDTWETVYSRETDNEEDFSDGILDIYYDSGIWGTEVKRVDDISKLNNLTSEEFVLIKGIRFRVARMSLVKSTAESVNPPIYSSASLELIEMSPRLEVDMTSYTESFSVSSTIGDQTSFGLPVGSVVISAGDITLYNEEQQFLFANILNEFKMLNQDVKFSIYQKIEPEYVGEVLYIPIKILYSDSWKINEDLSVSVSLEDSFKFLRETKAVDLLFSSGVPFSVAVLILLDNVGISGYEFKKSSNLPAFDKEDTVIKSFFCSKEQSVLEVLQQIAVATQCSMYYDAVGKLNILTKERLTENVSINESTTANPNGRTDFWMVGDESYDSSDEESSYLAGYKANIISFDEQKINPLTGGEVLYHHFAPPKQPMLGTLQKTNKKIYDELLLEQFPMNALAFSNYDYATTILWQPPDGNESVLGAANLVRRLRSSRLKDVFNDEYIGTDEEEAIKQMYIATNNDTLFPTDQEKREAKESLIIYLDQNEGYTFLPDFEGKVLIDKEYIEYRGMLFYIASTGNSKGYTIVFNKEEFEQLRTSLFKGDSLSFKGLVVAPRLNLLRKEADKYIYKVIGDGRGKFSTDVEEHIPSIEGSNGIDPDKLFKLTLGENFNYAKTKTPGKLTTTTKFNFLEERGKKYKSLKNALGTIPAESFSTYLGFLKLAGPLAPSGDTEVLNELISASLTGQDKENIYQKLNSINKQVDSNVPGDFDDYVVFEGERNLYGQKITLPFAPNSVTTRMRLYSPRKKFENFGYIMATNSSIAGIAFGLNEYNEGYYLEVETAGSGKDFVDESEAWKNNLRFYKLTLNGKKNGNPVYEPKLLLEASVEAYATFDMAVEVTPNDQIKLDPVFDLDIDIEVYTDATRYTIKYGDTIIGSYTEPVGEDINTNSTTIAMFVRNDSQAIFEFIGAAARPNIAVKQKRKYFASNEAFDARLEKGVIPVNKQFLFIDGDIKFYFNDFARLVREVKEYDIRFTSPAYISALLDVSKINPKYFIKSYNPTAFGAKLTVVNSSFGATAIGTSTNTPLYIVGVALQEINSGNVSMDQLNDLIDDDKKRETRKQKNISIYGAQSFSLDSNFIQSIYQARGLLRWISQYCSRQRLKLSLQIYPNPLLELGDKVRLFDKSRGYYIGNENYGDKTFTISSISHAITSNGPNMTVELIEVGEE